MLLMRKQGGEGGTFGLQNTESYGQKMRGVVRVIDVVRVMGVIRMRMWLE